MIAIHDLCFEDFPEYLQVPNQKFLKKFIPSSIGTADLVITITESTKKAIQKHYHTKNDKIIITPIPPATPSHHRATKPKGLSLPKKYILFVTARFMVLFFGVSARQADICYSGFERICVSRFWNDRYRK